MSNPALLWLLDKNVVRNALNALVRLDLGQPLVATDLPPLEVLRAARAGRIRGIISPELLNILHRRVHQPTVQTVLATLQVLHPTRYFRRWARRLHGEGFAFEDAKVIALGTFGMTEDETKLRSYPPLHLYVGIALAAFFWFASWTHLGVLGEYSFFPLWFGYILTVDALVAWRKESSLLTRAPREFIALFILSAPVWWVFEGLNNFVLNWHYVGAETYSVAQIIFVATINFSTVIPAIFETTELISTFDFPLKRTFSLERFRALPRLTVSPRLLWFAMYAGAFGFAAIVLAPQVAFPLTWLWLVLLADPLNALRGRPSLIAQIARGDWRRVVALALAGTVCGFFWELWNFHAWPKWYYTVPFLGFAKIFEMPLLGYGGYWPFAWELYALYHLIWGVLRRPADALSLDAGNRTLKSNIDNRVQ